MNLSNQLGPKSIPARCPSPPRRKPNSDPNLVPTLPKEDRTRSHSLRSKTRVGNRPALAILPRARRDSKCQCRNKRSIPRKKTGVSRVGRIRSTQEMGFKQLRSLQGEWPNQREDGARRRNRRNSNRRGRWKHRKRLSLLLPPQLLIAVNLLDEMTVVALG